MRIRLAISVEGQTEERFIKDLLAVHLAGFQIDAVPVVVATSRAADGRKSKGGGINTDRIVKELRALLQGFRHGYVTSLYDFYGFEDKLPKETVDGLEARPAEHAPTSFRYGKGTKVRHGPVLATRLTLPVIRAACPRFDAWVGRLETPATP